MSNFPIITQKELPIKISHEVFKTDKNLNIISTTKSNRSSKLSNYSNINKKNDERESKSTDKINKIKFKTEKDIIKIKYKKLYRFNSSSELTNSNTQNNSYKEKSKDISNEIIKIMISPSNSNSSKKNVNLNHKLRKIKLNKMFNKNLINFDDRRKIKKLNSYTALRLYGLYLQTKNQKMQMDEIIQLNRTVSNQNYITDSNYLDKNFNNNNYTSNNSFSNIPIIKTGKQLNKHKKNYSLNELIKLNPYHLVPEKVLYSDNVETEKISEKLTELNTKRINIKNSNKTFFFKYSNMKNNKIGKMLNNFLVQFNGKISYETDFIWRILSMIINIQGYSPFYNAFLFKGYSELWKNYSILLEQLLVKYPLFKWFFERNKYMKVEVLREFISCLKIEIKDIESFTRKLILLFGENNLIDTKLFLLIMELTSNADDIVEKVNFFVELFSDLNNEENCINIKDLFNLFRNIFKSSNCRKDKYFSEILKKEFNNGKKFDNNLYISKIKIRELFLNNKFIQKKMKEFIYTFDNADKNYYEQINTHFYSNARMINNIFSNEKYY